MPLLATRTSHEREVNIVRGSLQAAPYRDVGKPQAGTRGCGRVDACDRRAVRRRMVELWLRNSDFLHARIQEPEYGYVQGDVLFPTLVPGRLYCGAAIVPRAMGLKGLLEPGIYDGTGVAAAMANIIGGDAVVFYAIVVMLVFTLLLSAMTSMMGSSRTLYQASVDGWLPRYVSHVNEHGAPQRAQCGRICVST
jgi:hypothetical protein